MESERINRIKVVLVKQNRTGNWLAEQLGKDEVLTSKYALQPWYSQHVGEIEAWGRGIERIITACKNDGFSTPEFRYDASGVWTTFAETYRRQEARILEDYRIKDYGRLGRIWNWHDDLMAAQVQQWSNRFLSNKIISTQRTNFSVVLFADLLRLFSDSLRATNRMATFVQKKNSHDNSALHRMPHRILRILQQPSSCG